MQAAFSYVRGGENVFMPAEGERKPGTIGLNVIGGILEHIGGLTVLGCATVNSYRRFWETGFWAPVFADWGYQNRTCSLRVSAPGRFEYRAVDSTVNPYLVFTTGHFLRGACQRRPGWADAHLGTVPAGASRVEIGSDHSGRCGE